MKTVYKNLRGLGLTKPYIQQTLLPDWWDDEAAETPAGLAEGLIYLSRALGFQRAQLQAGEIVLDSPTGARFKSSVAHEESEMAMAGRLALQVARQITLGVSSPPLVVTSHTAESIREEILDKHRWVDLESLLEWCWDHGIPVAHVSNYPRGVKRMQGMAASVRGRPCIILSWKKSRPGWLLFVLAHELGHIIRGHVPDDSFVADATVDRDSTDAEEIEANQFAVGLLCGQRDLAFRASGRWPKAQGLASEAVRLANRFQVAPGHVVLNYAYSMGKSFYGVGNAALALLESESKNALQVINHQLNAQLDWSALPEESSEFVARMTNLESANHR